MRYRILQPEYFSRFSCIGPACEDTCCAGWSVAVDKATYKFYMQDRKGPLAKRFKEEVKRSPSSSDQLNFGMMKLTGNKCPFLNEDLWCQIHSAYGSRHLPIVCDNYPRMAGKVDDTFYRSLNTSCPEAVRVMMQSDEPMGFEWVEAELDPKRLLYGYVVDRSRPAHACFEELLYQGIDILQDRTYTLEDRLVIYGMYCEALEEAIAGDEDTQPMAIAEEFANARNSYLREALADKPQGNAIMTVLLVRGILEHLDGIMDSERLRGQYGRFLKGLGIKKNDTAEFIAHQYDQLAERYRKTAYVADASVYEHYLVNYVFRTGGVALGQSPYKHFCTLIVLFVFIRVLTIGSFAMGMDSCSRDALLLNIQLISKLVEHNKALVQLILDAYSRQDLLGLGHMSLLIYN